jgi:hypothetical protein
MRRRWRTRREIRKKYSGRWKRNEEEENVADMEREKKEINEDRQEMR